MPTDNSDFDWNDAEATIVCHTQLRTAVYWNPHGQVVIRQEGDHSYQDDDPFVFFSVENIPALIKTLHAFSGDQDSQVASPVPRPEERMIAEPERPAEAHALPATNSGEPLPPFLVFLIHMFHQLGGSAGMARLTKAQITHAIISAWPADSLGPIKGRGYGDKAPAAIEYMATFLRPPEAQYGGLRPWRPGGNGKATADNSNGSSPFSISGDRDEG